MALTPGTRLGPYEIVSPLGAGGMGEVYRARDIRLRREVAVKVLPAGLARDPQPLRRLEQEARAIAALNHPNLLSVFDVGTTADGSPYLVIELLEGQPLRQRLADGPLPQRKAVEVAIQVARGLAAAHDKGIVHRDLKPENIFCTGDGRVKILDFGLAKQAEAAGAEDQTAMPGTAAGVVLGTVGYMSPEQVRGQPTDARSDIFSLGAVLYEMLTGARAFRGDSAADVMSAILREEPPELLAAHRDLAPAVDRIVRHCLEKNPEERFQSARDLAFQLGDLSQHSSASGVAPLGDAAIRRPRFALGYPQMAAAGLLLAVAVGAGWAARNAVPWAAPRMQRATYELGIINNARFLPDGQSFVASAQWDGAPRPSLYSGRFSQPGLVPLNLNNEVLLSVSRSGEFALLRGGSNFRYGGRGTFEEMPLSGGAPRPVLDQVGAVEWAPDGVAVAVVRNAPEENRRVLEYPIGHPLYRTGGYLSDLRFSPDGRRIAFLEHPLQGDDRGHVTVIALGGAASTLTRDYFSAAGLAWSPAGDALWFSAGDTTDRALYAVSLSGRTRLLLQAPGNLTLDDVARDGRALLTISNDRVTMTAVGPAHPGGVDVTVLDWAASGRISADGRQVLVGDESAGPNYATFLRSADGSPPIRLGDGDAQSLSPDGQWALSLLPSEPRQLLLLPTGAGQPRPLTHGDIDYQIADWLPDSRTVVAVGHPPGGQARTYLIGLDGHVRPLTPPGFQGTAATPDDNFVVAQGRGRTLLFPVAGGTPRPVPGFDPALDIIGRFGATANELYVARSAPDGSFAFQVWRLHLDTGRRDPLMTVTPADPNGILSLSASISAEGKSYTYTAQRSLGSLWVVSGLH